MRHQRAFVSEIVVRFVAFWIHAGERRTLSRWNPHSDGDGDGKGDQDLVVIRGCLLLLAEGDDNQGQASDRLAD
jgi:hypothetical protein